MYIQDRDRGREIEYVTLECEKFVYKTERGDCVTPHYRECIQARDKGRETECATIILVYMQDRDRGREIECAM